MQRSAETAEFNQIVKQVADFILPAFTAAMLVGEIPGTWSPPGPWTKK